MCLLLTRGALVDEHEAIVAKVAGDLDGITSIGLTLLPGSSRDERACRYAIPGGRIPPTPDRETRRLLSRSSGRWVPDRHHQATRGGPQLLRREVDSEYGSGGLACAFTI